MVDGMRFTRQPISPAPVQLSIFFLLPFLPFLPFLFKVSYVYYYGGHNVYVCGHTHAAGTQDGGQRIILGSQLSSSSTMTLGNPA